ncbi:MAG: hypothetical protein ACJAUC_002136, partial [Planctomycetota bacterium]
MRPAIAGGWRDEAPVTAISCGSHASFIAFCNR